MRQSIAIVSESESSDPRDGTVSDSVPSNVEQKVVELARKHPSWSTATLHRKGARKHRDRSHLKRWENDVKNGGSNRPKCQKVNDLTFVRFKEARSKRQPVTTHNLLEFRL